MYVYFGGTRGVKKTKNPSRKTYYVEKHHVTTVIHDQHFDCRPRH